MKIKNKKIVMILVIFTIILVGVSLFIFKDKKQSTSPTLQEEIKVGDDLTTLLNYTDEFWLDWGRLKIIFKDNYYYVYIIEYGKIKNMGILSKDGEWVYNDGFTFIDFNYDAEYEGYTLEKFEQLYGQNMINVGSLSFMPVYFTEDGKMIYLDVYYYGEIQTIGELDIVTNKENIISSSDLNEGSCDFKSTDLIYEQIKIGDYFVLLTCFSEHYIIKSPKIIIIYKDDYYTIYVSDEEFKISGIGVYAENGEWISNDNLNLIDFNYDIDYEGYTIEQFEQLYGKNWTDTGTEFFTPVYFTKDGKMVYLLYYDGLNRIFVQDIITGKIELDKNYKGIL